VCFLPIYTALRNRRQLFYIELHLILWTVNLRVLPRFLSIIFSYINCDFGMALCFVQFVWIHSTRIHSHISVKTAMSNIQSFDSLILNTIIIYFILIVWKFSESSKRRDTIWPVPCIYYSWRHHSASCCIFWCTLPQKTRTDLLKLTKNCEECSQNTV